jgi:phage gp46-like protein
MSDIGIQMLPDGQGFDLTFDESDLLRDDGLYTDVLLSLFTDARANDDDVLPDENSTDRRGYWADEFAEVERDRFGSRLWLLARSKQLSSVMQKAQEYAEEALAWLIDDGVATDVIVTASVPRTGILGLKVVIKGVESTALQYQFEIRQ